MISGLSHLTLICADLDRAEALFVGVLGARKTYDSGDVHFSRSAERFFDLGGVWIAVMQGESLPTQTYNHIAFQVDNTDIESFRTALERYGATLLPDRPRVAGEGHSLYFLDDDNHMFELHSGTLDARLARYAQGNQRGSEVNFCLIKIRNRNDINHLKNESRAIPIAGFLS